MVSFERVRLLFHPESRLMITAVAVRKAIRKWWLADRQIIFRSEGRIRFLHFNDVLKVAALGIGAWILYSTISFFVLQNTIDNRDTEIALGQQVYREIVDEIAASRRRFDAIAEALERNDLQLVRLLGRDRELKGNLEKLRKSLDRGKRARRKASKNASGRKSKNQSSLAADGEIRMAERSESIFDGTLGMDEEEFHGLVQRYPAIDTPDEDEKLTVADLESHLNALRRSQRLLLDRMSARADDDSQRVEQLVARTGLDIEGFLKRAARSRAQGGPFIPLGRGSGLAVFDDRVEALDSHLSRWERVQRLLRSVPMASPINRYYFASRFGKRRDPIRKRWALHGGIDLAGPMRSKVHTMAPGRVKYAGWRGPFGRMVEIDHGMGVRTRYAHLNKLLVKRRERVAFGQVIGLLGSSGRSTGPHLHYEILINRKRVDPTNFIKAGRNVF